MPRWSVDLILDDDTRHLGTVETANAKQAIEEAIRRFKIEPARRNGIRVTKISELDDWP